MNIEQAVPHTERRANSPVPPAQDEGPILQAVRGIRFGSVEITIQDGRIVQIERKEKIRVAR